VREKAYWEALESAIRSLRNRISTLSNVDSSQSFIRNCAASSAEDVCFQKLKLEHAASVRKSVALYATQNSRRTFAHTRNTAIGRLAIFILWLSPVVAAQNQPSTAPPPSNAVQKGVDYLVNYLNMAGATKARDFRPMTQRERNHLYFKTMTNPLMYLKAAFSAGIDQWNDKPTEWQQGMSGYGKRYGNILGQYSIQRTVTFGLASALHEDNRYFNSGKQGVWKRTGYALSSGVLARKDDGSRHVSISQLGGVAAGAFLSRLWQPPSQSAASNGAISFGITMASNIGFSVVKEFLPDLGRKINQSRANHAATHQQQSHQ